ncbi:MAG: hypothetical protein WAM62_16620 [Pseudolabrys sp.]
MMFKKAVMTLAMALSLCRTAAAAEWQYCLAPSNEEHKIYFSGAFATNAGVGSADSSFEQALIQARLSHDEVQCPRADTENSILAMMQDAVAYNQKIGRKVVYVRWEPGR